MLVSTLCAVCACGVACSAARLFLVAALDFAALLFAAAFLAVAARVAAEKDFCSQSQYYKY